MEKVRIGVDDAWAIKATTVLESMPPLRKAPIGTSLTMWQRTASVSCPRRRSIHSGSDTLASGANRRFQYRDTTGSPPSSDRIRVLAGGSFWMARKMVLGAGT